MRMKEWKEVLTLEVTLEVAVEVVEVEMKDKKEWSRNLSMTTSSSKHCNKLEKLNCNTSNMSDKIKYSKHTPDFHPLRINPVTNHSSTFNIIQKITKKKKKCKYTKKSKKQVNKNKKHIKSKKTK